MRAREGRREGPWRNNVTTSNPSTLSKGRDEQKDERGYKAMVNGRATFGMIGAPLWSMEEKFSQSRKVHEPINASRISGDPPSQEREAISLGDSSVEIREGQLHDSSKIVGGGKYGK